MHALTYEQLYSLTSKYARSHKHPSINGEKQKNVTENIVQKIRSYYPIENWSSLIKLGQSCPPKAKTKSLQENNRQQLEKYYQQIGIAIIYGEIITTHRVHNRINEVPIELFYFLGSFSTPQVPYITGAIRTAAFGKYHDKIDYRRLLFNTPMSHPFYTGEQILLNWIERPDETLRFIEDNLINSLDCLQKGFANAVMSHIEQQLSKNRENPVREYTPAYRTDEIYTSADAPNNEEKMQNIINTLRRNIDYSTMINYIEEG